MAHKIITERQVEAAFVAFRDSCAATPREAMREALEAALASPAEGTGPRLVADPVET